MTWRRVPYGADSIKAHEECGAKRLAPDQDETQPFACWHIMTTFCRLLHSSHGKLFQTVPQPVYLLKLHYLFMFLVINQDIQLAIVEDPGAYRRKALVYRRAMR